MEHRDIEYKTKREEKHAERLLEVRRRALKKQLKIGVWILGSILIVGGLGYLAMRNAPATSGEILATSGLHWHPTLEITVKGEKIEIPANIGLGITHNPIHTHETDGVIHLEFGGVVTKDDTRLREFFEVWGKQFNRNCIFEHCTGSVGTLRMLVNGVESQEFENHFMKDGEKIEIAYE